jgi:hypothetical protein
LTPYEWAPYSISIHEEARGNERDEWTYLVFLMNTEFRSESLAGVEDREEADDIDLGRAATGSTDSYGEVKAEVMETHMKARVEGPLFSTSQKMRKRIALVVSLSSFSIERDRLHHSRRSLGFQDEPNHEPHVPLNFDGSDLLDQPGEQPIGPFPSCPRGPEPISDTPRNDRVRDDFHRQLVRQPPRRIKRKYIPK